MEQKRNIKLRKRRFWAFLLVIFMVVNLIPVSVYAASIDFGTLDADTDLSGYTGTRFSPGDIISWAQISGNANDFYGSYYIDPDTSFDVELDASKKDNIDYCSITIPTKDSIDWSEVSGITEEKKNFSAWIMSYVSISDSGDYHLAGAYFYALYEIKWVDGNGRTIKTDLVKAGDKPVYTGETPTKESSGNTRYVFNGKWSPEIKECDGPQEYVAQFDEVTVYNVTFKDEDETVLLGPTEYAAGTKADDIVRPQNDPTKQETDAATYDFVGWYPEIEDVNADAVYTAKFEEVPKSYTVKFVNDGKEISSESYRYGTPATDIVKPADPTREKTAQYEYTFAGWSPEIVEVTGDATYEATYSSQVRKYTVTFKDEDGTEISSKQYDYGTQPESIEKPADPTKASTAKYTYKFGGWTPEIKEVTGDATYTATYNETINQYSVAFVDNDNTIILAGKKYDYGTKAADIEVPANPEPKVTAQYTYTFKDWGQAIEDVIRDITYKARYTPTLNKYKVTFVDDDGTVLKEATDYNYGTAAADIVKPADPKKVPTAQYTYEFAGWKPEIKEVTGDATYTATYTPIVRQYTVTFKDEKGTELSSEKYDYGTAAADIVKPTAPEKEATVQYTYDFAGWTPEIKEVTGDATYTATYTPIVRQYTVTFKDEKGTELSSEKYDYGTAAADIVKPAAPEKKATAQYTYDFAGWTPEIEKVERDATYTATYIGILNKYKVEFVDDDARMISAEKYTYGTPASQITKPADPKKKATAQFTYTFTGWTPEIADVIKDAVYEATYKATVNQYSVTFLDDDGTVLKNATLYDYGTQPGAISKPADPTKEGTAQYSYPFTGWSPEIVQVTKDATYTATYGKTLNKYKVTFLDDDGSIITEEEYDYGTKANDVVKPADPTKDSTAEYSYTFTGWDAEVVDVTADATYTATYDRTRNKYNVTFVDEDGTILKDAAEYEYGTKADDIEKPEDPTKEATDKYTYSFSGWTPEITDVTADATYTATYEATKIVVMHSLKFDLSGGTLDKKTGVITVIAEEGSVIKILDAPEKEGYKFLYWKGSEYYPGDEYTVTEDHIFTAQWEEVTEEKTTEEVTTEATTETTTEVTTEATTEVTTTVTTEATTQATTQSTTEAKKKVEPSPTTGDSTNLLGMILLMSASIIGTNVIVKIKKTKRGK